MHNLTDAQIIRIADTLDRINDDARWLALIDRVAHEIERRGIILN